MLLTDQWTQATFDYYDVLCPILYSNHLYRDYVKLIEKWDSFTEDEQRLIQSDLTTTLLRRPLVTSQQEPEEHEQECDSSVNYQSNEIENEDSLSTSMDTSTSTTSMSPPSPSMMGTDDLPFTDEHMSRKYVEPFTDVVRLLLLEFGLERTRSNEWDTCSISKCIDQVRNYQSAPDCDDTLKLSYRNLLVCLLYLRGHAYKSVDNNVESCIRDYTEAIQLDNTFACAFNNRGYALYGEKKFQEAVRDYTRAIELEENNSSICLTNRAACYVELKLYQDAKSDFMRVLSMEPWNTSAKQSIAEVELHIARRRRRSLFLKIITPILVVSSVAYCVHIFRKEE